ncbi:hypothetical protein J4731_05190 [Providencia rettgeri]|nr:hypothetical protein [Providencia rettgeri]
MTERSGGNGAVAVFMACYDCFCTVYASGIQAASALRRGSMFDVMEQQRCYAAGQSP